jgi:hypothetical protein
MVTNTSEMDATARVLLLVLEAAWEMEIKLQPSLKFNHPTFMSRNN